MTSKQTPPDTQPAKYTPLEPKLNTNQHRCRKTLALAACFAALVTVAAIGFTRTPGFIFAIFDNPKPIIYEECQLFPNRTNIGSERLRQWRNKDCQNAFQCPAHGLFPLQRTCTVEDLSARDPLPRNVSLLITDVFALAYVVNPSALNDLVTHILTTYMGAYKIRSNQLTLGQRYFFFFSFVDNHRNRFVQHLALHPSSSNVSSCTYIDTAAREALISSPVPSQAYFLSGDAGLAHHDLRIDWLADATDVGNVVQFLHYAQGLQHFECFPEINFREINFDFLQKAHALQNRTKRWAECISESVWLRVDAHYRQDRICWQL